MKLMYSSGINARTDGLSQSTAHQDQSSLNLSIAQTCDVQKQQYQHREGDIDLMVRTSQHSRPRQVWCQKENYSPTSGHLHVDYITVALSRPHRSSRLPGVN